MTDKTEFFRFFWEDNFCFRDNLHIRYLRMNLLSPCCRWWYLFIVRLSPTFGSLNCRKTHSENAFNCFLGYSLHKGAEIAVCKLKRFFLLKILVHEQRYIFFWATHTLHNICIKFSFLLKYKISQGHYYLISLSFFLLIRKILLRFYLLF